ncbi:hypothetical protein GWI33_014297 [Rhynchophorus ferrugineus]|uniref:Uncharacterized protein n=1 Tax=Rhynchophorus ferrugineus TaxID=354439 RepID=A0A834I1R0_RHYFE|nr:hypothetical protein GWI33_014297 [Rhynchophorus ferrugineus]
METDVVQARSPPPPPPAADLSGDASSTTTTDESDLEDSDLKEVMRSDEINGSAFVQRYFQNHSNSLPSRLMVVNSRRLSQCREEDEDDEKKDQSNTVPCSHASSVTSVNDSLSESSSSSKTSVIDTVSGPTHKFVITKTKQPREPSQGGDSVASTPTKSWNSAFSSEESKKKYMSEAAKIFASRQTYRFSNTVGAIPQQTQRVPAYSIFSKSPMASPHLDSKFFDSSLIELKSQGSSTTTVDLDGSNEDVWVRRQEPDQKMVRLYPEEGF